MSKANEYAPKYTYRVLWSEDDQAYIATCQELKSLSAVGESREQALHEIDIVVRASLEWMEEANEEIPTPYSIRKYSGKLVLRIPEDLHREITRESEENGTSINQWILKKLCS